MKKVITNLILISFTLHVIWENVQAPLFLGYESFSQHFILCLFGTVGDLVITLFVYILISLLKNDSNWVINLNVKDVFVLVIASFFIAIWIEQQAFLFGKWSYTSFMPVIPYFKVGLTPILQMSILLPFSMYLTKKFMIKYNN